MNFTLRVDPGALVNMHGVTQASTGVEVTDSDLVVNLGSEFEARISRGAIAKAEEYPDPRPGVYFPMGLSSAVNQIGPDTVCVVTSYDGLVKVDLNQEIEGQGRFIEPTRPAGAREVDNTPIPTPPSGWRTGLRVLGVIIAIILLYQALTHGLGLLVLLLIVLAIIALVVRGAVQSSQQKRHAAATASTERSPITFRHIVVSLDDPQAFVRALNQRGGGVAARPVS